MLQLLAVMKMIEICDKQNRSILKTWHLSYSEWNFWSLSIVDHYWGPVFSTNKNKNSQTYRASPHRITTPRQINSSHSNWIEYMEQIIATQFTTKFCKCAWCILSNEQFDFPLLLDVFTLSFKIYFLIFCTFHIS